MKVYGFNACMMLYEHRPQQIVRAYFSERREKACGPMMKYLAAQKKAYHIVSDDELQRLTASTHHEGICLLVKRSPAISATDWLKMLPREAAVTIVGLVGVSNPHNLGAILRTCAHYGVPAIAVEDPPLIQSCAAVRTAQGGAEFVDILQFDHPQELLSAAHEYQVAVVATSSHLGSNLYRTELPARLLLLLGEETAGLSKHLLASADLLVRIPGTGAVESLNVSAASAAILGEVWRQRA